MTQPSKREERLAVIYAESASNAALVARICDEVLDPSGAMLGRIRRLAKGKPCAHPQEASR
jgi:hypothetical protein